MKAGEGKHIQISPRRRCGCCHLGEGRAGSRNKILQHLAAWCLPVCRAPRQSQPRGSLPSSSLTRGATGMLIFSAWPARSA